MAIMEVLLPVIFLNVCGMLLKAKFGLDGAESYLIALMGVLSFLYIGGIFNLLLPAAAGIFIGILLLLLAAVKKSRSQKRSLAAVCGLKEYFNPFVLLNNLSCLVFTVIFSISNPLFYYWDELAFWGTSAKATKLLDRLYSIWPTPLHNHLPPSNALLNYFFNFFSVDFQPYIQRQIVKDFLIKFTKIHKKGVRSTVWLLTPRLIDYIFPFSRSLQRYA